MMTNDGAGNNNCDDDNEPCDIFCNMINTNNSSNFAPIKESAKFGGD